MRRDAAHKHVQLARPTAQPEARVAFRSSKWLLTRSHLRLEAGKQVWDTRLNQRGTLVFGNICHNGLESEARCIVVLVALAARLDHLFGEAVQQDFQVMLRELATESDQAAWARRGSLCERECATRALT